MKRKGSLLLFCFVLFFEVAAQRAASGIWMAFQLPVQWGRNWQWHHDAGYRTEGFAIRTSQYLYRTGARYRLNNRSSMAAGIAFFSTRSLAPSDQGSFGKEFRLWQEMVWSNEETAVLQWQLRGRVEQRFFAATPSKSNSYADRFRLRIAVSGMLSKAWRIQVADEWMEQLRSGKVSFDQNRVMFNIIRKGKNQTQWQGGYMWLKWPNESQHILSVGFQKTINVHGN